MNRISAGLAAVAAVLALAWPPAVQAQNAPVVAAASDLNFALTEIAARFVKNGGPRVELVFGSSGTLTRQIQDGAPFELFLSADETFVNGLVSAGLARNAGDLYAIGRIVLYAPTGSPLNVKEGLAGLGRLVANGRVTRFAIANPEHAPYGRAAEAALRKHNIWQGLQPRLVLGENVSQAAQFAATGNATGGIIAYSLALAPGVTSRGTYALIPESDHAPLRQRMVLLKRASPAAERFYAFIQEPASRDILARYGFAPAP